MAAENERGTPRGASLDRWIRILLTLAAASSLLLGAARLVGVQCSACMGGALSAALPWAGGAFYAGLAALAFRAPASKLLAASPALYVFIHAFLVTDMVLLDRLCPACLGIAALAAAAAACQTAKNPREGIGLAAAVVCGITVGAFSSYDRVDEFATRLAWPMRLLERVPAWVDRSDLAPCTHPSTVRLLLYEKDCQRCGSLAKRLGPELEQDYAGRVCIHPRSVDQPPAGSRLPLLILLSRDNRVGVVEGYPTIGELAPILRTALDRPDR